MKASRKILNSVIVICLCSGSGSWNQQSQIILVCCNTACSGRSGSCLLMLCLLTPFAIKASESQTITVQSGESWCLWQWCWNAGSLAAGEKAGLLLLGRKETDSLLRINASFLCLCVHCKSFDVFCMLLVSLYTWLLLVFSWCLHCSFSLSQLSISFCPCLIYNFHPL